MFANWTTAAGVAALASSMLIGLGTGAPAAAAETKDLLDLVALTGPAGGDVTITVPAGEGGADVDELEHVQVSLRDPASGETIRVVNVASAEATRGVANVELDEVAGGTEVHVQAHVRETKPQRTRIVRGETVAKLRPDLVIEAVRADAQTLTTRPVDVAADVRELNGETGAAARLTLMLGPSPVAEPKTVTVAPGARKAIVFEDVRLEQAATLELTVRVEGADPRETDTSNNARSRTIEVTEHELVRSNVLLDALGGFGAQFNQHVYAPVTSPPAASLPDFEAKARAFEPHLVRIFYNDNFEERQPNRVRNLQSFFDTVQLAQEAGATINITYHAVDVAKNDPVGSMTRFAGVLEEAVELRGLTNVRWVTVANEPNSTLLTLAQYEELNRALHAQLVERGLRPQIGMMGGDLVRDNQRLWFQYIATNMNDLFDAYSVHVYWDYWNTPFFMETRLKDIRKIVTEELPPAARKPTYVMEYGVRGARTFAGKPTLESGYWEDGTDLARTNVAAFQQLWFGLAATQLGFAGAVKWDAYWGKYTATYNSLYAAIGPAAEGWPLYPTYHALRLLFQTTERGWRVLEVAPWAENDWRHGVPDSLEKEVVAYAGPAGELTFVGLDSGGQLLNAATPETRAYSLGGVTPGTRFMLALWNAAGDGATSIAGEVGANDAGVVRFEVPVHAAFSLTTVAIS